MRALVCTRKSFKFCFVQLHLPLYMCWKLRM
uniref:Uncharacterized protein n=1 Tax=Rhizophora mucronata TaxID=61149 RepID=A0A2P2L1B9_RHIMU